MSNITSSGPRPRLAPRMASFSSDAVRDQEEWTFCTPPVLQALSHLLMNTDVVDQLYPAPPPGAPSPASSVPATHCPRGKLVSHDQNGDPSNGKDPAGRVEGMVVPSAVLKFGGLPEEKGDDDSVIVVPAKKLVKIEETTNGDEQLVENPKQSTLGTLRRTFPQTNTSQTSAMNPIVALLVDQLNPLLHPYFAADLSFMESLPSSPFFTTAMALFNGNHTCSYCPLQHRRCLLKPLQGNTTTTTTTANNNHHNTSLAAGGDHKIFSSSQENANGKRTDTREGEQGGSVAGLHNKDNNPNDQKKVTSPCAAVDGLGDGNDRPPPCAHAVAAYYVCEARERAMWAQVCQEVLYTTKMCEAQTLAVSRHHRLMVFPPPVSDSTETTEETLGYQSPMLRSSDGQPTTGKAARSGDSATAPQNSKLRDADLAEVDAWITSVDEQWRRERTERCEEKRLETPPSGMNRRTAARNIGRGGTQKRAPVSPSSSLPPCSLDKYRDSLAKEGAKWHSIWLDRQHQLPYTRRERPHSWKDSCLCRPLQRRTPLPEVPSHRGAEAMAVAGVVLDDTTDVTATAPSEGTSVKRDDTPSTAMLNDLLERRRRELLYGHANNEESAEGRGKRGRSESPVGIHSVIGRRSMNTLRGTMSKPVLSSSSLSLPLSSSPLRDDTLGLLRQLLYYRAVLHRREVPLSLWAGREWFLPLKATIVSVGERRSSLPSSPAAAALRIGKTERGDSEDKSCLADVEKEKEDIGSAPPSFTNPPFRNFVEGYGSFYSGRRVRHRRLLTFCPPRETQPWRYQSALCADLIVYWKLHRDAEARARLIALKNRDADAFAEHVSVIQITALLKIMEHTHAFMHRIGQRIAARAESEKRRLREEEAREGDEETREHRTSTGSSRVVPHLPCSPSLPEIPSPGTTTAATSTNLSAAYHRFKAYMHSTKNEFRLVHAVDAVVDAAPCSLRATLLPHQMDGLRFLSSLHANRINGILADEMGVGKTIQTLAFLLHLREMEEKRRERRRAKLETKSGLLKSSPSCSSSPSSPFPIRDDHTHRPHLVLAPLSVVREWAEACDTFIQPGTFRVAEFMQLEEVNEASSAEEDSDSEVGNRGKNRKPRRPSLSIVEQAKRYDLLLLPIHSVRYRLQDLIHIDWDYIVVDEAHKAVSNLETLTARNIMQLPFQRRLVLTGTPLSSDLKELWSLLYFLNPDVFSERDSFDEVFQEPFKMYQCKEVRLADEHHELLILRLHQILRPFMLRRTKKDVCQTLHMTFHELICPMTAMQQQLLSVLRERRRLPYYHSIQDHYGDDERSGSSDDDSDSDSNSRSTTGSDAGKTQRRRATVVRGLAAASSDSGVTPKREARCCIPCSPRGGGDPGHNNGNGNEEEEEEGAGVSSATAAGVAVGVSLKDGLCTERLILQHADEMSLRCQDATPLTTTTAVPTTLAFRGSAENMGLTSLNVSESTAQAICNHAFMHAFFPHVLQDGYGLKAHVSMGRLTRWKENQSLSPPRSPANTSMGNTTPATPSTSTPFLAPLQEKGMARNKWTGESGEMRTNLSLQNDMDDEKRSIHNDLKNNHSASEHTASCEDTTTVQFTTPCPASREDQAIQDCQGDCKDSLWGAQSPHAMTTDSCGAAEWVLSCSGKFLFLHVILHRVVAAGHKAVLFTHWLQCMDLLADYFAGQGWANRVEMLSGSTSEEERKQRVRRFHDDPTCSFFVVSMKAGGCGINLQVAHLILLLDRDYTTTNEDQALARVYRIGQRHTVRAISLTTGDVTEQKVVERAHWKNKPRQAIIEEGQYFVAQDENEEEVESHGQEDLVDAATLTTHNTHEDSTQMDDDEKKNMELNKHSAEIRETQVEGSQGGSNTELSSTTSITTTTTTSTTSTTLRNSQGHQSLSSRPPASSMSLQPIWKILVDQWGNSGPEGESSSPIGGPPTTAGSENRGIPPSNFAYAASGASSLSNPSPDCTAMMSLRALGQRFGDEGWGALRRLVAAIDTLVLTDEDVTTRPEVCGRLAARLPPASVADFLHLTRGLTEQEQEAAECSTRDPSPLRQGERNAMWWAEFVSVLSIATSGPAPLQRAFAMALEAERQREDPVYCREAKERRWAAKAERLRLLQLEPPQSFYEMCWEEGLTEDMDIRRRFAKEEEKKAEKRKAGVRKCPNPKKEAGAKTSKQTNKERKTNVLT